jgi:hypothetical protein
VGFGWVSDECRVGGCGGGNMDVWMERDESVVG